MEHTEVPTLIRTKFTLSVIMFTLVSIFSRFYRDAGRSAQVLDQEAYSRELSFLYRLQGLLDLEVADRDFPRLYHLWSPSLHDLNSLKYHIWESNQQKHNTQSLLKVFIVGMVVNDDKNYFIHEDNNI